MGSPPGLASKATGFQIANTRFPKIGFCVHMVDGNQIAKQNLPAAIQSSFWSMNNNTPAAFFKLLG